MIMIRIGNRIRIRMWRKFSALRRTTVLLMLRSVVQSRRSMLRSPLACHRIRMDQTELGRQPVNGKAADRKSVNDRKGGQATTPPKEKDRKTRTTHLLLLQTRGGVVRADCQIPEGGTAASQPKIP